MRWIIAFIVLAIASLSAPSRAEPVTVMRVIDGDTLIIGEPCSRLMPGRLMRIRVRGIDTPESNKPPGKCLAEVEMGKAATDFVRELIKPGDEVEIAEVGPDKYACRMVASVTLPDGRDLASLLIAAGHARPYDGGRKAPWCPARKSRARGPPG